MFAMLAVVLAFSTQPSAPASAGPPADAKPLREVVYKVSASRHGTAMVEGYGGAGGEIPDSADTIVTDNGTVTVDVMIVANNTLGLKVTELWARNGRPDSFLGNVAPDGSLNFPASSISDVTRELLPFFAPLINPDRNFDQGAAWAVRFSNDGVSAVTNYRVNKADNDVVTIDKQQSVKTSALGTSYVANGTISYKPSLLVPISGDVTKRASGSSVSANVQTSLILHFQRVSDTREAAAK